jgi:hypothetical protein
MPIIPKAKASSQLRTSGASISPSAAGAVGQALASLGNTAAGIGLQAMEKKKQADDVAFVSEQTNRLLREETEKFADIETRGADVDLESIGQEYQDRLATILEDAPSEEAANEVKRQADSFYSRKFFPQYSKHQSSINVKKRVNSSSNALDDINSEVLTGRTSVSEAMARSEAVITGLSETAGGVVDIDKLRQSQKNSIASGSLKSRIDSGDSRAVVKEIEGGKWDSLTDTSTLSKMLNAAKADIKQREGAARKKYASGIDDYIAFLSAGNSDAELDEKYSPKKVSSMFGESSSVINEKIQDARSFGETLNEIRLASPEEIGAIVEREKPTSPNEFKRESAQYNTTLKAISVRNKEISQDPAAYVAKNSEIAGRSVSALQEAMSSGDPEAIKIAANEYSNIQKTIQEDLGIPDRSVQLLTSQMEEMVSKQLNDLSNGGENAANAINTYKYSFGSDWSKVEAQLARNKKIGQSAQIIAMTPQGEGQAVVAQAVSTPDDQLKGFIGDDNFNDIKSDSFDSLNDLRDTLRVGYGESGTRTANTIQKGIEKTAMQLIADGTATSSGDAIDQAKEIILGDIEIFDTYRVPKKEDPDLINLGVSGIKIKLLNGEIPILAPPSSEISNPQDVIDVYLRSTSVYPITSLDGSGVAFVDNKNNVLRNPDGTPLEFTWREIKNHRPEDTL